MILRDVHQMAFHAIRLQVWNLQKRHSSKDLVRRVYQDCSGTRGVRKFQYGKCGRKAWKVDAQLRSFVVKRLLALRMKCICTSTTLQREVAKTLRKQGGASTIRKILLKAGYQWRPRAQKPKLSKLLRKERMDWCRSVSKMTASKLKSEFGLAMDGVVLSCPPVDPTDRANFCTIGDTHMYRKSSEAASAALAGGTAYGKQVPLSRAVPLWAGISSIPIVATANYSTCNLHFLEAHDWLGKESNRILIHLPSLSQD